MFWMCLGLQTRFRTWFAAVFSSWCLLRPPAPKHRSPNPGMAPEGSTLRGVVAQPRPVRGTTGTRGHSFWLDEALGLGVSESQPWPLLAVRAVFFGSSGRCMGWGSGKDRVAEIKTWGLRFVSGVRVSKTVPLCEIPSTWLPGKRF